MPIIGGRTASVRGLGFQGAGKPNQVTGLTATDVGSGRAYNSGRIDLSWTAPSSNGAPITGYFIERSTDSGSTWSTLVANTASSSVSYSDTGLSSATRYDYRVSAINAVGTGDASSSTNATATTVPQAPTVGTASRLADNQVSLTFTANATGGSSITSYTIESSPSISITTNAGTTSPRTATGSFGSGTAYTFTISAVNANGTSQASSASGSITPNLPAPTSIEYVLVAGGGAGAIDGFYAGGGGAGGLNFNNSFAVSPSTNYTVSVGGGGGGSSTFASTTVSGGGSGGWQNSVNGTSGGSGGGSFTTNNNSWGNGTSGQGNRGGKRGTGPRSGGGGGYSGAGGDSVVGSTYYNAGGYAGGGGGGYNSSITGTSEWYAYGGGGAGEQYYSAVPMNGDTSTGAANTGAGGGGWAPDYNVGQRNYGGSGVVIVAYPDSFKNATISGGLSYTTPSRSGYKVYRFTGGSGTISW